MRKRTLETRPKNDMEDFAINQTEDKAKKPRLAPGKNQQIKEMVCMYYRRQKKTVSNIFQIHCRYKATRICYGSLI